MRRQLSTLTGAVIVAAVAGTTLSACGMAFASTYEDDPGLKGKITAVRLDIGSGSVRLRGGAGALALHRKIKYRDDRPDGPTHRIENGVLVLNGCGSHCSVSYTVDVPAGLPVSGTTSSGEIKLTRVGAVDVRTSSGSIRLDGVTGPIKASTSNGRIEGRGLRGGRIEAQTSNGNVKLTPDTPQDVRAKTSNGDVTIAVPAGRYQLTTHTNNGDRDIDLTNDPSGQHRIDVSTSNGDITVKPAG
ncbi:DUF4097 family beta strand repeat-containing protein [Actinomadura macra]|uniref:DUF4097 family beta strand repeat-containing protein n=1 Tax=Actinomadura macra TaxID=46164 RepID=UPI00082F82F3|nr:DUF4097 family beta strand repeat-containing protein [Actinomadura macra]